ncbi:MAG: ribonuclease Z, partial [Flavobacteriaceae bacterium]
EKPLHIYGPKEIQQTIEFQLQLTNSELSFPLTFHETNMETETIFETDQLEVMTIPLNHRVACTGFLFREKFRASNIKHEAISTYQLSVDQIKAVKAGEDVTLADGEVIPNNSMIKQKLEARSYAFCTDTSYLEKIIPTIKDIDLLYHEATFTESEKDRAEETFHSTAKQAAALAKKANAKQLILGHFSGRYADLTILLDEAKEIFSNTDLALEQLTFAVGD